MPYAIVHRYRLLISLKGARGRRIELVLTGKAAFVLAGSTRDPEAPGAGVEADGEELGGGAEVDVAVVFDLVAVFEHRVDGTVGELVDRDAVRAPAMARPAIALGRHVYDY